MKSEDTEALGVDFWTATSSLHRQEPTPARRWYLNIKFKRQLFTCIEDDDHTTDCCELPAVCSVQGPLNRSA